MEFYKKEKFPFLDINLQVLLTKFTIKSAQSWILCQRIRHFLWPLSIHSARPGKLKRKKKKVLFIHLYICQLKLKRPEYWDKPSETMAERKVSRASWLRDPASPNCLCKSRLMEEMMQNGVANKLQYLLGPERRASIIVWLCQEKI